MYIKNHTKICRWNLLVVILKIDIKYTRLIETLFCDPSDVTLPKGVGMIRAEIGLKNRQIINETYSFRCFLIL
jgi:hypothetical protein